MPHHRLVVPGIQMPDVILSLIDPESLDSILSMSLGSIIEGMEKMSLRGKRPGYQGLPSRQFDVDLEGEILEWLDDVGEINPDTVLENQDISIEKKTELLLLLCHWSSLGEWRCWDARLFLYVEPSLDTDVRSTESFLMPSVWSEFKSSISSLDRSTFIESVVIDWMSRRENLGETMDPSSDPRILPTMESHQEFSGGLFDIMEKSRLQGIPILLGREYLEARSWHLGQERLENIIG